MEWVEDELGCVNIGDERLNKRAKTILKRLGANPSASIPESCKGWQETKAAYRFFENDLVTSKKIIKPHRQATLNRIKG
ncbi:Transposase DNA-binding, partial [Legionella quinlivanii DSM 21216]